MAISMPQKEADPYTAFLREDGEGNATYGAGLPGYPENFSRDVFESGIIGGSAYLLDLQLEKSARHQGTTYNPRTGEKPGKIHHQFPGYCGIYGRDLATTYNASETTALFLLGAEALLQIDHTAGEDFLRRREENLRQAARYILAHIGNDGLFWECPPEGNSAFGLKVTYWKDSILTGPNGKEEPDYPVAFGHLQFIAARGLLSAARLLHDRDLSQTADSMFEAGIREFIQPSDYIVYRDQRDQQAHPSSDELHSLAYIPTQYQSILPTGAIEHRARVLATPFGYACTPREISQHMQDQYHGYTVWTYEQAKIYYAAMKYNLGAVALTAAAVEPYINEGQELFTIKRQDGQVIPVPTGNKQQLWSVAAKVLFADPHNSHLLQTQWL